MGCAAWMDLVTLQAMGSTMNIMVTVTCFDRGVVLMTVILSFGTYLGIVEAVRGVGNLLDGFSVFTTIFCVIMFCVFI